MRLRLLVWALAMLVAPGAARAESPAAPAAAPAPVTGWNEMGDEQAVALARSGDPLRGRLLYDESCAACHLPSGAGRPDGAFPQLAGQHATVIVKQLADIRAGRRANATMQPYAMALTDPQELADVAAYLQSLPAPESHGTGPGGEEALARGARLYAQDCASCHGPRGGGDAVRFVPRLAGQHYEYLLRQIRDVASQRRKNAHPLMVQGVQGYTDADLQAVVDHASRLAP